MKRLKLKFEAQQQYVTTYKISREYSVICISYTIASEAACQMWGQNSLFQ